MGIRLHKTKTHTHRCFLYHSAASSKQPQVPKYTIVLYIAYSYTSERNVPYKAGQVYAYGQLNVILPDEERGSWTNK